MIIKFDKLFQYKIVFVKNIDIKILKKIILFMIYFLFININIISKFNNFISYLSYQKDIKEIENYLKRCENSKKIKKFKIYNSPKISIISPIYNRERFILRFLKSIQYQNFKNIEIIFIDDCSIDNSVKIIEKLKKEDERIRLLKNKKNKGTFISRNLGVLSSKGKYLILRDPDDIISEKILNICYTYAEKYEYEIIGFSTYLGNGRIGCSKYVHKLENKPVYQPELSTYIFYGYDELEIIDFSTNNKFIKTIVYIKALNSLNNFYLNLIMTYGEDQIMNYVLLRKSKNFFFLKKIGYYYLQNSNSITRNIFKIFKLRIRFDFIFLKIIIDYSKNSKYEKDIFNLIFTNLIRNFNIVRFFLSKLSSKDSINFFYDIINISLNCSFITNENKNLLKKLKIIMKSNYLTKKIISKRIKILNEL